MAFIESWAADFDYLHEGTGAIIAGAAIIALIKNPRYGIGFELKLKILIKLKTWNRRTIKHQ
jgi:hypothetical protein